MPVKTLIKPSQYHDSVSLMLAARELANFPGVMDAAVVMATEANKGILREAGLLSAESEAASPNDLVIAVSGDLASLDGALAHAEALLKKKQSATDGAAYRPRTLRAALRANPAANVTVISVAGRYAADEAWQALHQGQHVLLFSDNVSLDDEIALKRYAVEHGLLLMGPGAGTAILNSVALGFANVVLSGPVGIVSAAGTGLQEVSTLLSKAGIGITQGIGTGGRDLKEAVGGLMFLSALKALQEDPATRAIVLVSKPPSGAVARKVLQQVRQSKKPTVVCLLGIDPGAVRLESPQHKLARTLEDAASLAINIIHPPGIVIEGMPSLQQVEAERARVLGARLAPGQRYLRGLFSGGTLCYEAQVIWKDSLSTAVLSNAPLEAAGQLSDSLHSQGHTAVDLGEEEFTVGRPHPMIDNDLRIRRLLQEGRDPEVAVILLDVVLGYGAHPDPAAELGPAVRQARALAEAAGRSLVVVASITGTEQDPQHLSRQAQALEAAGVELCESNAAAARLVAAIVEGR